MKREAFGSRLGFILVSAGCAIGIGNVWKFPYICGAYGGAAFILIYLCFLVILGIPVLVAEFAVAIVKNMGDTYEQAVSMSGVWLGILNMLNWGVLILSLIHIFPQKFNF